MQAASSSEWWRLLFTLGTLPAAVLAVGLLIGASPESPSCLARRGLRQEAAGALQAVQGVSARAANKWVEDEIALSGKSSASGGSWSELFGPKHRRSLKICSGLAIAQALGGSNAVIYFGATMFAGAGASPGSQALASIGTGVCNLVGTCLALRFADTAGRKPMLLFSLGGMCFCMATLAVTQTAFMQASMPVVSSAVVPVAVLVYILSFGCGVGPLPPLMYSEVRSREFDPAAILFAFGSFTCLGITMQTLRSDTVLNCCACLYSVSPRLSCAPTVAVAGLIHFVLKVDISLGPFEFIVLSIKPHRFLRLGCAGKGRRSAPG